MHICHLVLNNIGGAPKVADSLISSQVKAGHKVSTLVLAYLDTKWEIAFQAAEQIVIMKVAGNGLYIGGIIHQISIAVQLSQVISNIKPDIMICHTAFITKLFALSQLIPGSLSLPYISYIHTDFASELPTASKTNPLVSLFQNFSIDIDNRISLYALQQADGLVFVCKTLYERLAKFGLEKPRILISYNPAIPDTSNYPLHSIADSWLNNPDLITFVCAARFHHQKDHKTLLNAFAKVSQNHSNARLILLGDGELEIEMQSLAKSLDINEIVLFAGSVSNPRAYFSLCRAVILPSHFEGFGMVLVEAVASGVTFIASDCPVGPREISEVLECGTIVKPSDVDALAAAIIEHVKTPQQRIDRCEQIAKLFSESSCAQRLESLLQEVVDT
jgi:glycosyltransferase involved in cell wall biosynthesis